MDVGATLEMIAASALPQERDEKRKELAAYLNQLILDDFPALVQTLYRVDISEQKINAVLKENPSADAGDLLAELMIQRQQEKQFSRQRFRSTENPPDEEAW